MGMPDRTRDFTSATVDDILRNLEGPTEESRAFRDFWNTYGQYFKADYSAQAAYIDEFVCRSRYLMSVVAPAKFKGMIERVTADDAKFAADCEATCEELRAYGNSIDVLIDAISDKNFPASFDAVRVEAKLQQYAAAVNPAKAAFVENMQLQFGFDAAAARIA